ncbi:hypothetical protein BUZ01_08660 [Staphylococcus gallinarum]|uniref:Phage protein n=1 Tax=Staphylococcus gallinarum TaxID=1293 RepID=A0A418HNY0_STAGA|nr:hypothetical protein [Staphylococcus gallinarum]RIL42917.1 hypothetical protein BUZ01_08660 [Staphylococcus gallinarum]
MKIKTKKQLNLPQLIEWAMKNDMHERSFCGDRYGDAVHFDENEDMLCDHVSLTETFTVEVEEEITEDTRLDLIERFIDGMGSVCYTSNRMTIKESLRCDSKECTTTHFYIENDDRELVLIWRDGKLVE